MVIWNECLDTDTEYLDAEKEYMDTEAECIDTETEWMVNDWISGYRE